MVAKILKKMIVKLFFAYDYPSKSELKELQAIYDFKKLWFSYNDLNRKYGEISDIWKTFSQIDIETWINHFNNRVIQMRKSFEFLMFYFNKGIPDDEWLISTGRKGQSIEYFPHFNKLDFISKSCFDYYSDVFYYKIFSAFDTIGQILNQLLELEINNCDFKRAISKLSDIDKDLSKDLNSIINDPVFINANKIRNDITHNYLPNNIDSGIDRISKNEIHFGAGNYTKSRDIKDNIHKILDLFCETIKIVKVALKKYSV